MVPFLTADHNYYYYQKFPSYTTIGIIRHQKVLRRKGKAKALKD
jgi:hypothetical protein